jgi:hypothetical protein
VFAGAKHLDNLEAGGVGKGGQGGEQGTFMP